MGLFKGAGMNDAQIKHMVDRFLRWSLPETFRPDGGVSFKRLEHDGKPYPMPSGTNLLDATQAGEMVRFMIEGLPEGAFDPEDIKELERMVPPEMLNAVLTHNPLHLTANCGVLAPSTELQ